MTNYSKKASNEKNSRARATGLRVHFKNARNVGAAIRHMSLTKAKKYLQEVLEHKQAIPFTRYNGGRGRHAHGKLYNAVGSQVGYPKKATEAVLGLLKNAEANAESKDLNLENLVVDHVQCNRAPQYRRRTYRAHGRINSYMSSPAHIELILSEKQAPVKAAEEKKVYRTKKQLTRSRAGAKIAAAAAQ